MTSISVVATTTEDVKSLPAANLGALSFEGAPWTTGILDVNVGSLTKAIEELADQLRREVQARCSLELRVDLVEKAAGSPQNFCSSENSKDGDDCIHETTNNHDNIKVPDVNLLCQSVQRLQNNTRRLEQDFLHHKKHQEQKMIAADQLLDLQLDNLSRKIQYLVRPEELTQHSNEVLLKAKQAASAEGRAVAEAACSAGMGQLHARLDRMNKTLEDRLGLFESRLDEFGQNINACSEELTTLNAICSHNENGAGYTVAKSDIATLDAFASGSTTPDVKSSAEIQKSYQVEELHSAAPDMRGSFAVHKPCLGKDKLDHLADRGTVSSRSTFAGLGSEVDGLISCTDSRADGIDSRTDCNGGTSRGTEEDGSAWRQELVTWLQGQLCSLRVEMAAQMAALSSQHNNDLDSKMCREQPHDESSGTSCGAAGIAEVPQVADCIPQAIWDHINARFDELQDLQANELKDQCHNVQEMQDLWANEFHEQCRTLKAWLAKEMQVLRSEAHEVGVVPETDGLSARLAEEWGPWLAKHFDELQQSLTLMRDTHGTTTLSASPKPKASSTSLGLDERVGTLEHAVEKLRERAIHSTVPDKTADLQMSYIMRIKQLEGRISTLEQASSVGAHKQHLDEPLNLHSDRSVPSHGPASYSRSVRLHDEEMQKEMANISNALRGAQRDSNIMTGKLEDVVRDLNVLKARMDTALPQLFGALQQLAQHFGSCPIDGAVHSNSSKIDDMNAPSFAMKDLEHLLTSSCMPFASEEALKAVMGLQGQLQSELEQLRQDILKSMKGKADNDALRGLAAQIEELARAHKASVMSEVHVGAEDRADNPALVRWPLLPPGHCVSCNRAVELADKGRQLPWDLKSVPNAPYPQRRSPVPGASDARLLRRDSLPALQHNFP